VVEAAVSPARRPRRGLVVIWLVLALLVAGVIALEVSDRLTAKPSDAGGPRLLVPVPVSELGAIEIADAGKLHRFERDGAGAWFYHGVHSAAEAAHSHAADPEMATRIERVLAAFGRTRVERTFPLDKDGGAYGVNTPETLILLYRPNQSQPFVQYAVGATAPDTVSRYVMVVGTSTVITIPSYMVDHLLSLVRDSGLGQPAARPRS
jgi:hypothetical protein